MNAWDGPTDQQSWNTLKSQVRTERARLESLYDRARDADLDVERAFVSMVTIDQFLEVAQWDYDHPEVLEKIYAGWPLSKRFKPGDHLRLPFEELEDCLEVADHAAMQVTKQLAGEIVLAPSVDMYAAHKVVDGPNITMNGQAVFPVRSGIPGGARAYGGYGSGYHYLRDLGPDLKVKEGVLARSTEKIPGSNQSFSTPITHFHGNAGPLAAWMVDGPYGIVRMESSHLLYNGGRNFVNYDISNPHILKWVQALKTDLAAKLAEANAESGGVPIIHILANEPHFDITANGWRVKAGGFTDHFIDGFRAWLEKKYGTIDKLRQAHRDDAYRDFASYPVDVPVRADTGPGTPQFHELVSYNLDRGNHYFALVNNAVKKGDPTALTTIKLLGGTVVGSATGGIDFEYLTNMMDVTGSDFEAVPDTAFFFGKSEDRQANDSWLKNYSFYWSVGTQTLDYAKTLKPNAPHFNSEWHGFSTGGWRDFDMKREYVRAAFWIHYTHGLNLNTPWWWGRGSDGAPRSSATIGALGSLPVAVDEFGRVMKELNAHGNIVAALANQDRFAFIYWSRDAAIHARKMNHDGQIVYEALKLLNYSVGMTSKHRVAKLDPAKHTIVVPPTNFMPAGELQLLKDFQSTGGRVIAFERDGEPFAEKDEYGFPHTEKILRPYKVLKYSGGPYAMAEALSPLTDDLKPVREFPFKIFDQAKRDRYGVMVQEACDNTSDSVSLFLINVSKVTLTVDFGRSAEVREHLFTDLLRGGAAANRQTLEPMAVRLIRARHGRRTERQ